jgi:hypothetical protein
MMETESDNLKYIGRVFMGLSSEKQDYLLDTARSLLEVQNENIPVNSETASHGKKAECTVSETMSAYAGKKYEGVVLC